MSKKRLLLALGLCLFAPAAWGQEPPVQVSLELNQQFFYEGDALPVRVSVRNAGGADSTNPVQGDLYGGLTVSTADGAQLERRSGKLPPSPSRPGKLAAGTFYGGVVDVTEIYPKMREVGQYRLHWAGNGLLSRQFEIRVIPRFDPKAQYRATLRTNQGDIQFRFYSDKAPIAAKAFIDMANSGFYDGLEIQEVRKDTFIVGGDPRFGDRERQPFQYPAEINDLPMTAGTVVMKPAGAAPPANGPEFIILLKPQPNWQGQVTAFAQVSKGLDVVQKISRVANSGPGTNPSFRPTQPIRIQRISLETLETPPAGTAR